MLAPRLTMEPRVASLDLAASVAKATGPRRKRGPKVLKNAAVERRKARPSLEKGSRSVACSLPEQVSTPASDGAPLPHLRGEKKEALRKERKENRSIRERINENQD